MRPTNQKQNIIEIMKADENDGLYVRTTKQLLELTLEYFKKWDIPGICQVLQVMNDKGLITRKEFHVVNDYIKSQRPTEGYFFDKDWEDDIYFWNPENREIREQWMEHLIDNLK